jgi:hypothetical protein
MNQDHGRSVRGRSHAIMMSRGARRLRGRLCRVIACVAKVLACWLDRRFSGASDIHSRMILRRRFDLAISNSFLEIGGRLLPDSSSYRHSPQSPPGASPLGSLP